MLNPRSAGSMLSCMKPLFLLLATLAFATPPLRA